MGFKDALCHGQKFGHDFAVADSKCAKCGVDQKVLSKGLQKIEYFVRKPEKGIHSEMHALAKEISEYCGEPKKFGMYLGVIKNIGLPRAYKIFSEIKHGKEIKTPGKLFLYLSAYRPRTPSFSRNAQKEGVRGRPKTNGKNGTKTKYGNRKRTGKNTPEKTKKRRKSNP